MNDVLFPVFKQISLDQILLTILKFTEADTVAARREARYGVTMKFTYEKLRSHLLGKGELG